MTRRVFPRKAALQALAALQDASEASEGRMMLYSFKMEDWFIGKKAYNMKDRRRKVLDANLVSELSRDRHRLEYIVQLCEAVKNSASELLKIHNGFLRPIAPKLSKGIASLPDELLGLIFKFACHHEEEGTRHALWLSQVSRRFRRVAHGERTLWSTQFHCYDFFNFPDVARCINRAGADTDLHIVMDCNFESNYASRFTFTDYCSCHCDRWKTLSLIADWDEEEGSLHASVGGEMVRRLGRSIAVFPRLHELRFIERRRKRKGSAVPAWFPSNADFPQPFMWSTPNLRVLRCAQYIPPPSFPFKSITSFSLSLTFTTGSSVDQITRLCMFLRAFGSLLEIDLELVNQICEPLPGAQLQFSDGILLPSVTSFRFSVSYFETPREMRWLPGPFMKILRMPNLEHFTFSSDDKELPFDLIPDSAFQPHIKTLVVEAPRPRRFGAEFSRISDGRFEVLDIPLREFPNVSSLTVTTTYGDLFFLREQVSDEDGVDERCGLRELRLRSCDNMDVEGLQRMVLSLKDVGAWDTLERVYIQSCELLEYGEAEEVLGREKLHFSRA